MKLSFSCTFLLDCQDPRVISFDCGLVAISAGRQLHWSTWSHAKSKICSLVPRSYFLVHRLNSLVESLSIEIFQVPFSLPHREPSWKGCQALLSSRPGQYRYEPRFRLKQDATKDIGSLAVCGSMSDPVIDKTHRHAQLHTIVFLEYLLLATP